MSKIYRVGITFDYEPDDNGYFDWEDEYEIEDEDKDEDFEPRSQAELLRFIKREFLEAMSRGELSDWVSIEEVEDN